MTPPAEFGVPCPAVEVAAGFRIAWSGDDVEPGQKSEERIWPALGRRLSISRLVISAGSALGVLVLAGYSGSTVVGIDLGPFSAGIMALAVFGHVAPQVSNQYSTDVLRSTGRVSILVFDAVVETAGSFP